MTVCMYDKIKLKRRYKRVEKFSVFNFVIYFFDFINITLYLLHFAPSNIGMSDQSAANT